MRYLLKIYTMTVILSYLMFCSNLVAEEDIASQILPERLEDFYQRGVQTDNIFQEKNGKFIAIEGMWSDLEKSEIFLGLENSKRSRAFISISGHLFLAKRITRTVLLWEVSPSELMDILNLSGRNAFLVFDSNYNYLLSNSPLAPKDWDSSYLKKALANRLSLPKDLKLLLIPGTNLSVLLGPQGYNFNSWYSVVNLKHEPLFWGLWLGEHLGYTAATLFRAVFAWNSLPKTPSDFQVSYTQVLRLRMDSGFIYQFDMSWIDNTQQNSHWKIYVWPDGSSRSIAYDESEQPFYRVRLKDPGPYWIQIEGSQTSSFRKMIQLRSTSKKAELVLLQPQNRSNYLGDDSIPFAWNSERVESLTDLSLVLKTSQGERRVALDGLGSQIRLDLSPGSYTAFIEGRASRHPVRSLVSSFRVLGSYQSWQLSQYFEPNAPRRDLWLLDWPHASADGVTQ